jgi:hypothetical protein
LPGPECFVSTFENVSSLFSYSWVFQSTSRQDSSLVCPGIKGDDHFRIAKNWDVCIVRRNDHLAPLADPSKHLDDLCKNVSVIEIILGLIDEQGLIACS